jgi:hypothetical protein
MTEHVHYTVPADWLAPIRGQGVPARPDLVRAVINAAMRAEHDTHLGAESLRVFARPARARQRRQAQDRPDPRGGIDLRRPPGARQQLLSPRRWRRGYAVNGRCAWR